MGFISAGVHVTDAESPDCWLVEGGIQNSDWLLARPFMEGTHLRKVNGSINTPSAEVWELPRAGTQLTAEEARDC